MSFLLRNIKLSPFYALDTTLALGLIAKDVERHHEPTPLSLFALTILCSSFMGIRGNYFGCKRVVRLLKRHGYKDKHFTNLTKTFCGRQQLKLAAKQTGFIHEQNNHFQKLKIHRTLFNIDKIIYLSQTAKTGSLIFLLGLLTKEPETKDGCSRWRFRA